MGGRVHLDLKEKKALRTNISDGACNSANEICIPPGMLIAQLCAKPVGSDGMNLFFIAFLCRWM